MAETNEAKGDAERLAYETGCAIATAEKWLRGEAVRGAAAYACSAGAERLGIERGPRKRRR